VNHHEQLAMSVAECLLDSSVISNFISIQKEWK